MTGRHSTRIHRVFSFLGILACLSLTLAACGTTTTSASEYGPDQDWHLALALGRFLVRRQGFQQGYQLWVDLNQRAWRPARPPGAARHRVGRQRTDQVTTNYQKLITVDKVDLIFGPYSSLLTKPASVVANRYGYAMVEGAGGGPSVFTQGLNNVFDVSLPVANNLDSFAVPALDAGRPAPASVAYATEDDPFTQPQVDRARGLLEGRRQDGLVPGLPG